MNTRLKESARETAVLLGMWAVAACGLMFIAQRSPTPEVMVNQAAFAPPMPATGNSLSVSAVPVLPASWRPDGATMLAQAKAAHRVYAPQSQVASRQPLAEVKWKGSDAMRRPNTFGPYMTNTFGPFMTNSLVNMLEFIGVSATFHGKVTGVFTYPGNTLTCLNFKADYRQTIVAVVKPANYRRFPDLQKLVGKDVLFRGTIRAYRDPAARDGWRPEIELTSPDQIQIVK